MFMLVTHIILMLFCIYEVVYQDRKSQKAIWTCMAICWLGMILCDIPAVF